MSKSLRIVNAVFPCLGFIATIFWLTLKWSRSIAPDFDLESVIYTLNLPLDGTDTSILFDYGKIIAASLPPAIFIAWLFRKILTNLSGRI